MESQTQVLVANLTLVKGYFEDNYFDKVLTKHFIGSTYLNGWSRNCKNLP